jgi:hypothetical protein
LKKEEQPRKIAGLFFAAFAAKMGRDFGGEAAKRTSVLSKKSIIFAERF